MLMANKKRLRLFFILLIFCIPFVGQIFLSTASAINVGTGGGGGAVDGPLDRAHILVGDRMFEDGDIDGTFEYQEQDPSDRCADIINGFDNSADFEGRCLA